MKKLIWAVGAATLLCGGGCCRWCDRWCGNNHCTPTSVQAAPAACVPCAPVQQCCPAPAAPVCCPTPASAPPPPSGSWQRSPGY